MHGGDVGGRLYFLLLKFVKRKKAQSVSQLILSPFVERPQ